MYLVRDDAEGVIIAPRLGRGGRHAEGVTTHKKNRMYVYILLSEKSSRYYVGQTADIGKRLKKHNNCGVPSTKFGVPWKLIKLIEVKDRSEAIKLEHKIKKRGAKRYLIDNQFGVYHAMA